MNKFNAESSKKDVKKTGNAPDVRSAANASLLALQAYGDEDSPSPENSPSVASKVHGKEDAERAADAPPTALKAHGKEDVQGAAATQSTALKALGKADAVKAADIPPTALKALGKADAEKAADTQPPALKALGKKDAERAADTKSIALRAHGKEDAQSAEDITSTASKVHSKEDTQSDGNAATTKVYRDTLFKIPHLPAKKVPALKPVGKKDAERAAVTPSTAVKAHDKEDVQGAAENQSTALKAHGNMWLVGPAKIPHLAEVEKLLEDVQMVANDSLVALRAHGIEDVQGAAHSDTLFKIPHLPAQRVPALKALDKKDAQSAEDAQPSGSKVHSKEDIQNAGNPSTKTVHRDTQFNIPHLPAQIAPTTVSVFHQNPFFIHMTTSLLNIEALKKCYLRKNRFGEFRIPDDPDVFKAIAFCFRQYLKQRLTMIIFNAHHRSINYMFQSRFQVNDDLKSKIALLNKIEEAERRRNLDSNGDSANNADGNCSLAQSAADQTASLALGGKKLTYAVNVKPKPKPNPKVIVKLRDVIAWMEEDKFYRYSGLLDRLYYQDART